METKLSISHTRLESVWERQDESHKSSWGGEIESGFSSSHRHCHWNGMDNALPTTSSGTAASRVLYLLLLRTFSSKLHHFTFLPLCFELVIRWNTVISFRHFGCVTHVDWSEYMCFQTHGLKERLACMKGFIKVVTLHKYSYYITTTTTTT